MKLLNTTLLIFIFSIPGYCQKDDILKENDKLEIVNKVAEIMQTKYVFADMGKEMSKFIKLQYKNGQYKSYNAINEFCSKLTSDLRIKCNNDKHLYVFYSPEEAYEVKVYKKLLPEDEINKANKTFNNYHKRQNYGFQKLEILEGNIGYLKLDYFPNINASEVCAASFKFLENTNAIIIDLRENGGGENLGIFLSSYFFPPKKILLGSTIFRDSTLNEENWTLPYVPGTRLPNIDLYVLTSSMTFSAAEGFAYDLQQIKRATIIGEATKGGAHPIDILIVKGDILTQVPIGYSYNPITSSNWEGIGVKPNIEVSAKKALETAHIVALKRLIKDSKDSLHKSELESIINN